MTTYPVMKRARKATPTRIEANLPDLELQDSRKNMIGEITLMRMKLTAMALPSASTPIGPMIEHTIHMAMAN